MEGARVRGSFFLPRRFYNAHNERRIPKKDSSSLLSRIEEHMSDLQIDTYYRKPFAIQGVLVTSENMEEAAKWCGGVVTHRTVGKTNKIVPYIQVRVAHATNERQTQAFVGDYILYAGKGYKVYNPRAFKERFDPVGIS